MSESLAAIQAAALCKSAAALEIETELSKGYLEWIEVFKS